MCADQCFRKLQRELVEERGIRGNLILVIDMPLNSPIAIYFYFELYVCSVLVKVHGVTMGYMLELVLLTSTVCCS